MKPSTVKLSREEILQRISNKRRNMVDFPPLNCRNDLEAWIARVEEDMMTGDTIPRSQWSDAAMLYLAGYKALDMLMRQQRARRMEAGGSDIWIWEDFQESLSQVLSKFLIQRLDTGGDWFNVLCRGKRLASNDVKHLEIDFFGYRLSYRYTEASWRSPNSSKGSLRRAVGCRELFIAYTDPSHNCNVRCRWVYSIWSC